MSDMHKLRAKLAELSNEHTLMPGDQGTVLGALVAIGDQVDRIAELTAENERLTDLYLKTLNSCDLIAAERDDARAVIAAVQDARNSYYRAEGHLDPSDSPGAALIKIGRILDGAGDG